MNSALLTLVELKDLNVSFVGLLKPDKILSLSNYVEKRKLLRLERCFYFPPYLKKRGKTSTQSERFFYVDWPIDNIRLQILMRGRIFSKRENFLSPNCNNFAIEWNWNNKISQNVKKLGFLKKKNKLVFLRKKPERNFFKIFRGGKIAAECMSYEIFS